MHIVDWAIVVGYIAWLVTDGVKRVRLERTTESYFLANRSLPWWAVGLSVMATQLSAITLVGTTGQGYNDGLRFIQFYYGLPLAMIILSVTLVPFFYRARVYTAYEYLERRFDLKTRTLTSLLFLVSRGLAVGTVVAAPAVVLSVILGWDVTLTSLAICLPAVVYTVLGGVQAVTWTDVKVMGLTIFALLAAVVALVLELPSGTSIADALHLAGATGRLQAFNFEPTLSETYTVWSGLIGGLFLMLSYFGCDQSQVQRYLAARSIDEGRSSLLMSAFWKIPLQVLVLVVGVLTFVFYVFHPPPMLFNPVHERTVRASVQGPEYQVLEQEFAAAVETRRHSAEAVARSNGAGDPAALTTAEAAFRRDDAAVKEVKERATTLVRRATGDAPLCRRELRFSDVHHDGPSHRAGGPVDRRHHHGGDRHHRGRAEFVGDRHGHRLLQASPAACGHRRAGSAGLEDCHRRMGRVCLRGRGLCQFARIAHRGGQPFRLVLLRLDSRRVHAGPAHATCHRHRGLRRAHRRHECGRRRRVLPARHLVSVAQRRRRVGRVHRRPGARCDQRRTATHRHLPRNPTCLMVTG